MYEPPGVLPEGREVPLIEENKVEPEKLRDGPRGAAPKAGFRPVVIAIGELDPVLDAHLLPKDNQIIVGHRHLRAVLTTDEREVSFLSSGYDPCDRMLNAEALFKLLVAVSDRVMDEAFPTPETPEFSIVK